MSDKMPELTITSSDFKGWCLIDGVRVYTVEISSIGQSRQFVAYEDFLPMVAPERTGVAARVAEFLKERDEALTPADHSDAERTHSSALIAEMFGSPARPSPEASVVKLLRAFQSTLGPDRECLDEDEAETWDEIEAAIDAARAAREGGDG